MSNLTPFMRESAPRQVGQNDGRYIDLIPKQNVPPETRMWDLLDTALDFRLTLAGLQRGERGAVSKAVGNTEWLVSDTKPRQEHRLTVGDVQDATVEELARLPNSGVRTARILKALVG